MTEQSNRPNNIVVFFFMRPISTYETKKFDFARFEEHGFTVKVLNLGQFIRPGRKLFCDLADKEVNVKYVVNIESYEHLKKYLRGLPPTTVYLDFILALNDKEPWSFMLYRILKKLDISYYVVDIGAAPTLPIFEGVSNFLYLFPKKLKIHTLISYLIRKIILQLEVRFNLLAQPKKIYALGDKVPVNYLRRRKMSSHCHVLINSEDYSKVMTADIKPIGIKNYCVFIDQNLPFHRDAIESGRESIPPEQYYNSLSKFFDHVEKNTGLEVIIAAHPGTSPDNHYYGKRKLFHGKTLELVRDCSLAIVHDSTAISYVVIYEKPIIFIVTNRMVEISRDIEARQLSHPLGLKHINIDNKKDVQSLNLDFKQWQPGKEYLEFKRKYHHAVDTQLPAWQIVINDLLQHH